MRADTSHAAPPVLSLRDVTVVFGGLTALDSVSAEVGDGQVVGVIGPNGAGKTTLFNVMCGFTKPTRGSLSLHGRPWRPRPDRLAGLGVARTLQGLGLFRGMTALDNVVTGATHTARRSVVPGVLGGPVSAAEERRLRAEAVAALDQLGVADVAAAYPETLPYAVRKKVALARALVARPRLLLLDEPAGGLGHEDIEDLAALIRSLPRERACSVVLVEHHVDMVLDVCDHVVVLEFGRVIAAGPPDVVREDPAVTRAYLGADVDDDDAPDATAQDSTAPDATAQEVTA
ncbi:ABC transporter ATP-binding protein [Thalassiella azotivora]